MSLKRLLLVCGIAGLAPLVAVADSVIPDPAMGIDGGSDPTGIMQGTMFNVNPTGGGTFDYFNGLGNIITSITFQTNVPFFNASAYACESGFFLHCSFTPSGGDGDPLLTINFFGVNPSDGDELGGPSEESEINEFEGIPPQLAGCTSAGCPGNFVITLNDNFVHDPNGNGGWTPNALFTVTQVTTVPEPGSVVLVLTALAIFGLISIRRRNTLRT
jgi:hypothetical protein